MIAVVLWGTAAAVLLFASNPRPVVPVAAAAIFGVIVGLLQCRSLCTSAAEFRAADSAVGVRRVMMSTPDGKAAITLQWVGTLAIVSSSLLGGGLSIPGILGSLAVFFFVRDALALPGVLALNRTEVPDA